MHFLSTENICIKNCKITGFGRNQALKMPQEDEKAVTSTTKWQLELLKNILEDSTQVRSGYGIPSYIYAIAYTVMELPEESIAKLFERYNNKEEETVKM